ncbi:MAG: hypothetical protein P8016_03725 [Sedimentisphaerales bacterium]
MTYLAIPISAKNSDQAQEQIKAASAAGTEMLEFRLDYLEGLSVELTKKLISEYKSSKKCRDTVCLYREISTRNCAPIISAWLLNFWRAPALFSPAAPLSENYRTRNR